MTTQEFQQHIKALGLKARKKPGLEAVDIVSDGTEHCTVTYAEMYPLKTGDDAIDLIAQKMRPEYIPPLG